MKVCNQFLERNQTHIKSVFNNLSKQGELPATSVFNFLRSIFQQQTIRFFKNNKDYFSDDNNQSHTQKTIEQYYKSTPGGKSAKFYLYRINFEYEQIQQYLQYWLSNDSTIRVEDQLYVQQKPQRNPQISLNRNEQSAIKNQNIAQSAVLDNQFLGEEHKIPLLIAQYQKAIDKYQKILEQIDSNSVEAQQIHKKIQFLKVKIKRFSPDQISNPSPPENTSDQHKDKTHNLPKAKTQTLPTKNKKQLNLKMIFDFYARQNQFTGVKSSFDRIQHESQTINYQKLVHFLKQYQIFPEQPKNQKKLFNLYVKVSLNTKDLHYEQFVTMIEKMPEIIIQQQESAQKKREIMMSKILAKNQRDKLFHNPFHSLQKQNFRIDSSDLKYLYKLKPINGKLQNEVTHELQNRKKTKEEAKLQAIKQKQQKQLKKLKKLMQIDPYHPLVVKNSKLLEERSNSVMQPVASLENMQRFRDIKFDMKSQFGIADFEQDPLKQIIHRYQRDNRANLFQKQQSQKMNALMSSIVQRTQAKLAKLGLSPKKRQSSSKVH